MALTFGALTSDRVANAAHASFQDLTTFSVLLWAYVTSFAANKFFWSVGAAGQKRWSYTTTGTIDLAINRATLSAEAISTTTFSINTWTCVGCTWDGTNIPKIYLGDLTTPLAEVAYDAASRTGSGAITSEAAGAMNWGNRVASSAALVGKLARCQYWNATLTLTELQQQQFRPSPLPSCVIYHELGYVGTGTQPDWSSLGTNTGTVTGATVSDGPPLPAPFGFRRQAVPYVVAPPRYQPWAHGGQDARFAPLIAQ